MHSNSLRNGQNIGQASNLEAWAGQELRDQTDMIFCRQQLTLWGAVNGLVESMGFISRRDKG